MAIHMMNKSAKFQAPVLWISEPHKEKKHRPYNTHGVFRTHAHPLSRLSELESTFAEESSTSGGLIAAGEPAHSGSARLT
jgi:hypothetical protein